MTLYHCSPTPGLTVLKPSVTRYFGKPRQVCLTACLPMALMYGVKHFEYTYGYTREGQIYYEEYCLNALEELYRGKGASLYTCSLRPGMETTQIPNEYVTPSDVPVEDERFIPDLCAALLEQERLGTLKIVRWADMSPARRQWVLEAEAETVAEQDLLSRPDAPLARFIQEKHPASWALALKRSQGGRV